MFFVNTTIIRQNKIAKILGCSIGSFPRIYLGLPLETNALDSFWDGLIKKFNKKLSGWKGNLLSQARKIILLKACLQSTPTYSLSLFKILVKFAKTIDKIQRNFLWFSTEEKKRMALIAWDQVCKPINDGDLGIRSVCSMNKALLAKKGWRVYHDDKEWSTIWKHKYLFNAPSLFNFLSYPNVLSPSTIWGAVQGAKNTLSKRCSWKIGNRLKVKF